MSTPTAASHQKTEPFTKVTLKGYFETVLVPGASEHEVIIQTDSQTLKHMRAQVEDGELTIKYKKSKGLSFFQFSWGPQKCLVQISAPLFESIRLKGAGKITATAPLRSQRLEVKLDGTGKVDLDIETQQYCELKMEGTGKIRSKVSSPQLKAKLDGTGSMKLEGAAQQAQFSLGGVGAIDAGALIVQEAKTKIKGMGELIVNAQKLIEEKTGVATVKNIQKQG